MPFPKVILVAVGEGVEVEKREAGDQAGWGVKLDEEASTDAETWVDRRERRRCC